MIAAFGLLACCIASEPEPPLLRVRWTVPLKSHCFGSGAVADVDHDGRLDVAFATYFGDARVRVISGVDGKEIWSYHDPDPKRDDCYDASVRFADVTGDGRLDLVVPCSSGSRVLCFDAENGRVQWNMFLGEGDCIDTPPWIGDCDGTGRASVVVGTFKSRMFVLRGVDGSIARTLNIAQTGAVQSCPIVMDLNSDGVVDFVGAVFGRKDFGVYALNGKDGSLLWHAPTGNSIYHGPAAGILPGPMGKPMLRLIEPCYDGKVYAMNQDGSSAWVAAPGERYIMSPATLADIDRDGTTEVLTACEGVTALRSDGEVMWSKPVAPGRRTLESVSRGVVVADLDDDGTQDLAYLTTRGLFRVLNGKGEVIYQFDAGSLMGSDKPASDCSHSPVLADLDGDGKLDAFFVIGGGGEGQGNAKSARYGMAVCLTGFAGKASAENCWPTMRRDASNVANTALPLDPLTLHAIGGR